MTQQAYADRGVLRFLTCGSVDDGKSTLIGRLLYDSRAILVDALDALAASSRRRGLEAVDLSLLTDGLEAEREQGITIDVAYRYFTTGARKYILADAPGHEAYTRNMVTAASTAELAVLLIDARKGVLPQTRRHLAIAHLMGLRHVVVAVNKMDLAGWDEGVFRAIREEVEAIAAGLGMSEAPRFIPLCALEGDMVVTRGGRLDWYRGPTLMEFLEGADVEADLGRGPLRFPVQLVCRPRVEPHRDFRGYMGRVESGHVAVGDAVTILPGGARSRVSGVEFHGEHRLEAVAGQSVTLLLTDDLDISRGDLIAAATQAPRAVRELDATLCWLDEAPLSPNTRLLLRHGARTVRAEVAEVLGCLDLQTQRLEPAKGLAMNDLAQVRLRLQQAIAPDPYRKVRAGGAFILIDEATNATLAAGMVLEPEPASGSC